MSTRTVTGTDGSERTYISCTDTAKLVRKALKDSFPGQKFSVRSDKYSGGASIRVYWTDGPTERSVDSVVKKFSGADFDGMVDLKTYNTHWLHPDGTVTLAHGGGQGSTHPEVIGDPVGPNAKLVHFCADFVFTQREVSPEWHEEVLQEFERVTGYTVPREDLRAYYETELPLMVDRQNGELHHMVEHQKERVSTLVNQYTAWRARA